MNSHSVYKPDKGEALSDRRALLLAASSLFLFGAFFGSALYRILGIGEKSLYDGLILRFFHSLFEDCDGFPAVLAVFADCLSHELIPFFLVFVGGFTLFTPAVSAAVLLVRGSLFGFALTMLEFASLSGILFDTVAYLIASGALSVLLILQAASAYEFYYPKRSPRLKSKETLSYLMIFLRLTALAAVNLGLMLFLVYIYL